MEAQAELAEADAEQLAEDVPRFSDDTALLLVVQAENLVTEAEVVEEDTEVAESDSEDVEDEPEPEGEEVTEPYTVSLTFDAPEEYDAFFNATYEHRNTLLRTNRDTEAERYERLREELRTIGPADTLVVEVTGDELNDLHNAIRSKAVEYQVENLTEQMDALNRFKEEINAV